MIAALHRLKTRIEGGGLAARIFGAGFIAVVIKIAAAGLSYAMFVVLARVLSQGEYGKFAFSFNLAIAFAALAGLGAPTAIMRFWPQYQVTKRADLARGALAAGATWSLVASIATGLAVAVAAPIAAHFGADGDMAHIVMAGFFIPGIVLSEYASAALRALGITFWSLAPRDVFWRAGVPLLAALAAWRGIELSAASALLMAGGLLLAITALQAIYALRRFDLTGARAADWPIWRKASSAMWGSAVLFALVQQFDVVIAGFFLPAAETGAYFAAQKTATLLSLLLIAGNLVSAPLISAHYHAGDSSGLQRLCSLLAAGIAIPTLIGFLLMVMFGSELLTIFSSDFMNAYPVLVILAAAATFDALAGPTSYFLQMSGRETLYLKIMAATYAGIVALQFILAPMFGMVGIAAPTALGVIIWNAIAVFILRRQTGIDPSLFGLARLFESRSAAMVGRDS